jgi:nitroimidazol reductase NimA-like FMN-containing flavoprotein (pyridoxamine 5'-phosphate oxidase superfamily)
MSDSLRMPEFRDLSKAECEALLARNHVGRLAFTFRDRVDVEPIGYVFDHKSLVMRTSIGSKLETLTRHPWVALEVDEVEGPFDWRSVVAHGTIYLLSDTGTEEERKSHARAVRLLRRVMPGTLTQSDPVPFRSVIMRLHIDRLTGRAAHFEHSAPD